MTAIGCFGHMANYTFRVRVAALLATQRAAGGAPQPAVSA
jgi:hypothetical protein